MIAQTPLGTKGQKKTAKGRAEERHFTITILNSVDTPIIEDDALLGTYQQVKGRTLEDHLQGAQDSMNRAGSARHDNGSLAVVIQVKMAVKVQGQLESLKKKRTTTKQKTLWKNCLL